MHCGGWLRLCLSLPLCVHCLCRAEITSIGSQQVCIVHLFLLHACTVAHGFVLSTSIFCASL